MSNESVGSISPVSDEAAAPHIPVMEEESAEDVVDDGADLSIDGAEPVTTAAEIDAAAKAGEISKAQAQSMKKKLKLKVNGVEEEVEFDMGDEAALVRELQKSRAFDKTAKDSAAYRSQVDQMMKLLMEDPETVLERLGIDVDNLSEKRLSKKIDEMKKSPEQVKQEKLEKELEDLRKEKKEIEAAKKLAEEDKLRNQAASQIENDIAAGLEAKGSFLPKNSPWVLSQVATYMMMGMKAGYDNVTAKDVIPLVEKAYREQLADLLDSSSEDQLEDIVGKKNMDRYRKSKVAKSKTAAPVKPRIEDTGSAGRKVAEPKAEDNKKYRMKDLFGYRK